MKAIKNLKSLLNILIISLAAISAIAQDASGEKKTNAIQKLLESKHFVFVAQSVTPSRGSFRQLTSQYDLRISNDSLISNLPYFGRAYSAPIDPASGGFNFTSTLFDYTIKPRKKNGWDVTIKPKDYKDVQQLFLNVFSNGSASLQVTSNSRQPIMFNGNIK